MSLKKKFSFSSLKKQIPSIAIGLACLGATEFILMRHYRGEGGMINRIITQTELKLLDMRFLARGKQKPSDRIGVLAIDEKSVQTFGRWPFPLKIYERVFDNLKKYGANWVGFDVVWDKRERPLLEDALPQLKDMRNAVQTKTNAKRLKASLSAIELLQKASPGETSFVRGMNHYNKIVMGYFYAESKEDAKTLGKEAFSSLKPMLDSEIQTVIYPDGVDLSHFKDLKVEAVVGNNAFLAKGTKHFAFFNNQPDPDAIVRSTTLVRNINGHLMPSLSLKTAAMALNREIVVFMDSVGVQDVSLVNPDNDADIIKIPVDPLGSGRALINHLGPDQTIPHFSMADIYNDTLSPEQKASLKGKTLLMGPTAIGINDQRANPFDEKINGVENHAAFVDNIFTNKFIKRPFQIYNQELAMIAIIGLCLLPFLVFGNALTSGVAVLAFLFGFYFVDQKFWFGKGTWVYMGMPYFEILFSFVAVTIYKYVVEEREKRKVKGAFQHYLSPDVMHQVLEDPSKLKLGGEKKEVTIFFSDVRGFTSISENLSPEKLCELMNDYLGPMTTVILKSGGVLDKYIGDAIMAFWGAPLPRPDHADVAVQSLLEMMHELQRMKVDFPKKGFPVVDIGCGLNTGTVSVGNMGSAERFAYTVMGDAVNLAARLESITKEYGVKLLISENTLKKVTPNKFLVRDLDRIVVKGKNEPVTIYEVLGDYINPNIKVVQDLKFEYESALQGYREQDWAKARKHAHNCLTLRFEDGPTKILLKRIDEMEKMPKQDKWDGVWVFKHK